MSIKKTRHNLTGSELVTCYTGPRNELITEGLATGDMLKGIGTSWRLCRDPYPDAGCWVSHLLDSGKGMWLLIRTRLLEKIAA